MGQVGWIRSQCGVSITNPVQPNGSPFMANTSRYSTNNVLGLILQLGTSPSLSFLPFPPVMVFLGEIPAPSLGNSGKTPPADTFGL